MNREIIWDTLMEAWAVVLDEDRVILLGAETLAEAEAEAALGTVRQNGADGTQRCFLGAAGRHQQ
jgi:hypothetical protein